MTIRNNFHVSLKKHAVTCRASLVLLFAVVLQSCVAPAPVTKLDTFAGQQGFAREKLRVEGFDLLLYRQHLTMAKGLAHESLSDSALHIYLEGDGSPWRHRVIVMPDPTPRRPLMLELMTKDANPSVYVGRPCYNGTSRDPGCDSRLWTSGRYSEQVVNSMAAAINVLVKRWNPSEIRLFGHSGGGALSYLLAEQLPLVTQIVTVAGNLDTDAWTDHHGYTPLYSSLNPAKQAPLREDVTQWHLVGGKDQVIPPQLVRPFISAQKNATGIYFNNYNHGCCWGTLWPLVLKAIRTSEIKHIPGDKF